MKNFVCVLFCLLGSQTLFGMQNEKPNWEEMHKNGKNGLSVRLKNTFDNHILSLSDMNLTSLDECDKLISLYKEAVLEVSHEELVINLHDDVIFQDDPIIKALSVARNPNLTTLPDCLTKFEDLEKLIISCSGIITFQPVLLKLKKLKHLVLSRHQFNQFVESEDFENLLKNLDSIIIEHLKDEPDLTKKAIEIAKKLTNKKLFDK